MPQYSQFDFFSNLLEGSLTVAATEEMEREIRELYDDGVKVIQKLEKEKEKADVRFEYQDWYTKALKVVQALAPDRLSEFRGYYEADPKRKSLGYDTYSIQDFFKGAAPDSLDYIDFDVADQAACCMVNQAAILLSLRGRVDSVLANIQTALIAEFQDAEVDTARELLKVSPRAAGALAGVLLEEHLQKVAANRSLSIAKRTPTIADLNDSLKQAEVYETPAWRKISYLADIRNLCTHKKGADPTPEQANELIEGVNWTIKNIA